MKIMKPCAVLNCRKPGIVDVDGLVLCKDCEASAQIARQDMYDDLLLQLVLEDK